MRCCGYRSLLSRVKQPGLLLVALAALSVLSDEGGDAAAGVEKTAMCIACHGEDGNGVVPDYPNLAGQNQAYTLHQLRLIKSREREIPTMATMLDAMTDQDLKDLAAHYASLPGKIGQSDESSLALGESIYRGGILKKGVAACTSCHAPDGQGNRLAGFPRVSGQPIPYTVAQLKQFREGRRTSDERFNGMMRDVASKLTDSEIEAVANYMLGLY